MADAKKGYVKWLVTAITLSFLLFIIFIGIYFYLSFNKEFNAITSTLNVLRNGGANLELINNIKTNLADATFLFTSQAATFIAAIICLIIGLWYSLQLYLVEKRNALIDPLTQLYNRKAVFFELKRELRKSERYGHPTSVAMLDLDFFKKYNDNLGHIAGDRLLKRFAMILKENVREYDIYGRYGGEEFIIVFPETGVSDAGKVCHRIRESLERTKFYGQDKMPFKKITVSVGVAEVKGRRKIKKETLIHNADVCLYKAKESGRNQVQECPFGA
ncbi:MAG TPA: GGDEF domain-containing protein [Candidatus Nanoarchaeia archaeon]|nr:GGDEF domain-containing protein [Candidatus Nanoarchaeia archaeon]